MHLKYNDYFKVIDLDKQKKKPLRDQKSLLNNLYVGVGTLNVK